MKNSSMMCVFFLYWIGALNCAESRCSFQLQNNEEKKLEFKKLLDKGIKLIHLDLQIWNREFYTNRTQYLLDDQKLENGILRWIWTTEKWNFLLGYPDDLPAITFNLLDGVFTEHLSLNISIFSPECDISYDNDSISVYSMIYNGLLTKNDSESILCHRYFKKQKGKDIVYITTNYWIGYDNECFPKSCLQGHGKCEPRLVKKSHIIYVVFLSIAIIWLYFPLFFILLPERLHEENVTQRLDYYQNSDTPYSISRFFLNINRGYICAKDRRRQDDAEPRSTIIAKLSQVILSPEYRTILAASEFLFIVQCLRWWLLNEFIVDYERYSTVYGYADAYYFGKHPSSVFQSFEYGFIIVIAYTLLYTFLYAFILSLVFKMFIQSDNKYYALYLWSGSSESENTSIMSIKYEKVDTHVSSETYYGYTAVAHKFVQRINILFKSSFYEFIFSPLFVRMHGNKCFLIFKYPIITVVTMINAVLNFMSCAFPLIYMIFHPFKKQLHKFIELNRKICFEGKSFGCCYLSAINCILGSIFFGIFTFFFYHGILTGSVSFLLRSFIFSVFVVIPMRQDSLKFFPIVASAIVGLIGYYNTFTETYKVLLQKCISESEKSGISQSNNFPVDKFSKIAEATYPFRVQIALLIAKTVITFTIVYVTIDTVFQGFAGDSVINIIFPVLLAAFGPIIAMRMYGTDPVKDVEKHSELIKRMIEQSDDGNEYNLKPPISLQWNTKCTAVILFVPRLILCIIRLIISFVCPCAFNKCCCICCDKENYDETDDDEENTGLNFSKVSEKSTRQKEDLDPTTAV